MLTFILEAFINLAECLLKRFVVSISEFYFIITLRIIYIRLSNKASPDYPQDPGSRIFFLVSSICFAEGCQ